MLMVSGSRNVPALLFIVSRYVPGLVFSGRRNAPSLVISRNRYAPAVVATGQWVQEWQLIISKKKSAQ